MSSVGPPGLCSFDLLLSRSRPNTISDQNPFLTSPAAKMPVLRFQRGSPGSLSRTAHLLPSFTILCKPHLSVWMPQVAGSGLSPVCISPRSQRCLVVSKSTNFIKFWNPGWGSTGVPWFRVGSTGLSGPPGPQSLLTCQMQMMKTPALSVVVWENLGKSNRHQPQETEHWLTPAVLGRVPFFCLSAQVGS